MTVEPASPPPWDVPVWVTTTGKALSGLLIATGALVAWFCCYLAAYDWMREFAYLAILLLPLVAFIAVFVHEIGHVKGAEWGRMTPVRMQLGNLDFLKQSNGWRVRWYRNKLRVSGFVVAYPHPAESLRGSAIKMIIGGPLANLLAAIIFFGAGQVLMPSAAAYLCFAFAAMNTAMGVANLMPMRFGWASDGLQLLWWLRGMSEGHRDLAFMRLMGRTVSGTTADKLPASEVAMLAEQAMPMPLIFEWLKLKASHSRNEWQAAEEVERSLDRHIAVADPTMLPQLAELIAIMRAEISFSKAISSRDTSVLDIDVLDAGTRWLVPHLAPRLQALQAALGGDIETCEALLLQSQVHAERSVDKALHHSEARLRDAVIAIARQ